MRTGGQNKKPAALHVLQGTFRAHRHGRVTADPPAGLPEPPGALSGESQAEWDRMIVRLTAAGTPKSGSDLLSSPIFSSARHMRS